MSNCRHRLRDEGCAVSVVTMVMNEVRREIDHRLVEESVTIHRQSERSGNGVISREGASGT